MRINSHAVRRADRSPLRPIDTLFVDKGEVLIDNEQDLGPQWRRLIGEFLSHRLGGSAHSWGEANVPAFARQVARWRAEMEKGGPADTRGFFAKDASQWFLDMCDAAGVARPADEEAERIAVDTVSYVKAHLLIRSPVNGLAALRALKRRASYCTWHRATRTMSWSRSWNGSAHAICSTVSMDPIS